MNIVNDLRDTLRPKGGRGEVKRTRDVQQIVGITLHQTATADFRPTHPGLAKVPAHALVHRDGSVSLLHRITSIVYHGNTLNSGTIGIEVACRAAGTEGDMRTFWRSNAERVAGTPAEQLLRESTDEQLVALDELVRFYLDEVAGMGGKVRGLWAHRQGHQSRTSDPGSRIWSVAERVRRDCGLADVRDQVLGTGKPIPKEWRTEP